MEQNETQINEGITKNVNVNVKNGQFLCLYL